MTQSTELEIVRPDDWHLHLRDGAVMQAVLPFTSAVFGRAIVMPNLQPPVRTAEEAADYRIRVKESIPPSHRFEPLMTCYLTDTTDPDDVRRGHGEGIFTAAKLYPAGATTNSENGVTDVAHILPALEAMQEIGMPLLVHGEVTDPETDIFDREAVFIDRVLDPLRRRLPGLKVVLEHVTTADAVEYVRAAESGLAATITVHHLIINRNAMFAGGIRPHYYCLPVAKRERHRLALRAAAVSGDPRFFLGTDSAPHTTATKETACGCAGIFSAPDALSCLAQVFEDEQALDRLEAFASLYGPAFYGLSPNAGRVRLVRQTAPLERPSAVETSAGPITVFDPGFPVYWRVEEHVRS